MKKTKLYRKVEMVTHLVSSFLDGHTYQRLFSMRQIFIVFLWFASFSVASQDSLAVKSSTKYLEDSVAHDSVKRRKSVILQPAIYFDYGKLLNSISAHHDKYEGAFEFVFFEKFQAICELGNWRLSPLDIIEDGEYSSEGRYWRYGMTFMPFVDPESRLGLGVRYATALFKEEVNLFEVRSDDQNPVEENLYQEEVRANWYEVVFYSDKKFNKWLTFGFTTRLRILNDKPDFLTDTQLVPGYGNSLGNRVWAINLFLKIPF